MKEYQYVKIKECPFCRGIAELELDCHEDDHRYPRDFWFAKIECSDCEATQGYKCVSKQEAKKEEINKNSVLKVIKEWNERK